VSGKRVIFDLHRAAGFWSAGVLLTIAFSGFYLVFPGWVRPVVGTVGLTQPRPRGLVSTPRPAAAPLSIGEATTLAARRVPHGSATFVVAPDGPEGVYQVWLRRPGDVRRVYGDVIVWIDQWSGAALHIRDRGALPRGEAFLHWQFPLHSGEAFARPGRLVVLGAGLMPLLLAVTGTLIWRRKRRALRVGLSRGSAAPGSSRSPAPGSCASGPRASPRGAPRP
jgi:uncharacterized iron-regulated membrane protein